MSNNRKRTAVFISGRGSNMQALVAAARSPAYPAEIVLVVSNRPAAEGLAWAKSHGITALVIDHKKYASREDFEAALQSALTSADIELIALAGFMRLMTPEFVARWQDRMINIHPSLLPSFRGLNTHERALAEGVKIAGCTVHFVRAEMDTGPIIAQAAVAVLASDTPATLAARILEAEHRTYPHALALVASGRAVADGNKVVFSEEFDGKSALYVPAI